MVLHRAETHAFFWQLLASVPIAYLLALSTRSTALFKHYRGGELDITTQGFSKADQIRAFSKGFYALSDDGRYLSITDLRMAH